MLIAISQRRDKNKYGSCIDNLDSAYVDYFEKFGVNLLPIPDSVKNVDYYFRNLPIEGVILSSGNDINPTLYGSKEKSESVSIERDLTEKKLLDLSIKKNLPVLGMCRGLQFINVFFGGKLVNINKDIQSKIGHVASVHKIRIINQSADKLFGNSFDVNSYHNNGISDKTLSSELKAFAKSEDGLIEGFYHPKLPIAAIMWHPERKSPNETVNKKIINTFLKRELFWKK